MIKSLLKKSKTELVKIILLLVALVVVLGLLTVSRVFTIEKYVTDVSGFTPRPGTDPYEVVEPTLVPSGTFTNCKGPNCGGELGNPSRTTAEAVTPTPMPTTRTPRCIRFGTYRICGPKF